MEQKRPADIIQELLDYLWNGLGLEEKGWNFFEPSNAVELKITWLWMW